MKMKNLKLIIILFSLIFTNLCYSQSGWFWQNPYPSRSTLLDLFMINSNTGYSVGWNGVINKTINGGINWSQLQSNTDKKLYSVFFVNQFTGYIVTGDENQSGPNYCLKTTNSGLYWASICTFPNTHLNKVFYLNENTGYTVGGYYYSEGRIFKTTNGGYNWTQYNLNGTNFMNSVYFINVQTGFAAGNNGKLFKTTNEGLNWSLINIDNNFTNFSSITFINPNTGFISGWGGKIYKTSNAGNNWSAVNIHTSVNLSDIKFSNEDTGFAVGGSNYSIGRIFKTIDGGNTWDSILHNESLYAISINDPLIAVGKNGAIFRSSDSGTTWMNNKFSITNRELTKTFFVNTDLGFCVGDSGLILKTTNSGTNWNVCNSSTNRKLLNCYFINDQTGFVSGYSGTILKTTNSGLVWQSLVSNTSYSLTGLLFVNTNTGYCVGNYAFGQFLQYKYGTVLKTTNQGNTWHVILDSNFYLYNCSFVNENYGFVCGGDDIKHDKVLKTTDGGNSWSSKSTGYNYINRAIKFINMNTGFIGCDLPSLSSNSVLKTTNGGQNWISANLPAPQDDGPVYSIHFLNQNLGIVLKWRVFSQSGGDVFITKDGGNSWENYSNLTNYATAYGLNLYDLFAVNDSTAYAVGLYGAIIKLNKKMMFIHVQTISTEIPKSFILSQNYPNPFNPQTKIKFDIPANERGQTSNVKLIIYDLLGREVATLVNDELKPGTYEADWDGSSYSSGVYFYKLVVDDPSTGSGRGFVETKKMVLMK